MQDGCGQNEDLAFDFIFPAAATIVGSVVAKYSRDMKLTAHLRGLECICPYLCTATTSPWQHIAKKRKQTELKTKEMNWLTGRNSNLSLENKLLVREPRTTFRLHTKLERAYCQEKETKLT